MKNILAPLLLAAALTAPAAYAQKAGDTVTPEALGKLEWIKGEAPKAWEPGKLYVLECWATWCGPCVANIPHVDALYDKYSDKGLRVIGVDVWEDGKDKVADFVAKKGDGMSYPVAYTGKGGVFEKEWLIPAGVQGIPHAFLVKDGKVLTSIHPAQLTDELVEKLLAGGDAEKTALDEMTAKQKAQAEIGKAVQAFAAAAKSKDADAMATAVADLKAVQPDYPYLPIYESELSLTRGDWGGIDHQLEAQADPKVRIMVVGYISRSITKHDGVPAETLAKVTEAYETVLAANKKGPVDAVVLSRLYWVAGNKDKSLTEAKASVDLMKAHSSEAPGLSPAPFEKFSAAVEAGSMPTEDDFNGWMREAMTARAATAVKPAAPAAEKGN